MYYALTALDFLILFVSPHYVQMNIFHLISAYSPECLSDSFKPVSSWNSKNKSQKENSCVQTQDGKQPSPILQTPYLMLVFKSEEGWTQDIWTRIINWPGTD